MSPFGARTFAAAVASIALVCLGGTPASADAWSEETTVGVIETREGPAQPPAGAEPVQAATLPACGSVALMPSELAAGYQAWLAADPAVRPAAPFVILPCAGPAGEVLVPALTGLGRPALAEIAVAVAESELEVGVPDVVSSPPRGGVQLVGVPVWFWLEGVEPVSVTASVPGVSATLTATPGDLVIRISAAGTPGPGGAGGDVVEVRCVGPGERYDPAVHDPFASSGCSHPFDRHGAFVVEASVTWELSWTATNGQGGVLPDLVRTSSFPLRVQEAQAVTD